MRRLPRVPRAATLPPADVGWTVVVTAPLPDCPNVEAAWARIATQTTWDRWRPASKMRGRKVTTVVVPPATEPLTTGDEYIVAVNSVLRIHCRVLESSPAGAASREDTSMVFDATGVAQGGIVRSRFRFTVFQADDRTVMACAQEKITALPFVAPSRNTLEREQRHTLTALNPSFLGTSA